MVRPLSIERRPTPSMVDRGLTALADVGRDEVLRALVLAADVFCLLASYYLLKTARESLVLSERSAEVKSYAAALQALMLFALVPAYGALASRVTRSHLINGVLLCFAGNLVAWHMLAARGVAIGVPFFLWVGVFNLMVVAQFWAFANDLYSVENGERWFPVIGIGGSIGAFAGARLSSSLMAARVAATDLLLIAAGGLLVCVALNMLAARCCTQQGGRQRIVDGEQPLAAVGAFRLIANDRYLRLIALLVVLVNVVNTTGEYLLGHVVLDHATHVIASGAAGGLTKAQIIGRFYGEFFAWVNLLSLLLQTCVVSRVFRKIGVGGAVLVLPVIAACSYGLLAFAPLLGLIRFVKVIENGTDYSLQNTTRHALFLRTTREAKFKAKQATDALCWRIGDVLQAGVVFAGTQLAFGVRDFALVNEALVILWLVVAVGIRREHARRADAIERSQVVAA